MWDRFDAGEMAYANFMSVEGRRRYWRFARAVYPVIRDAQPGAAHHAIAELYRLHRLDCCITQNVDDLHRRAGLPAEAVIELHGNAARVRCLDCAAVYTRDEVHAWIAAGDDVPLCRLCGGIVKPTTVLFGEPMPARVLAEAERRARAADLFVVVGSSLSVYPAAYIPPARQARRGHARHRQPRDDAARSPGGSRHRRPGRRCDDRAGRRASRSAAVTDVFIQQLIV